MFKYWKYATNQIILKTITDQINHESQIRYKEKKDNGIFFTNEVKIIDFILDIIEFKKGIIDKKILEPAVGNGIFLLRIIERIYNFYPSKEKIKHFIENGLYFIDIDPVMISKTKKNISDLYESLFGEKYNGKFNAFVYDFTGKVRPNSTLFNETKNRDLELLLRNIDYVIGNPPYVTLYGRRDRKRNELQRINYLRQYKQFPQSVKNGKINYVMLFLEHSLDFLKKNGKLAFIVDISFFETAYKYTRKYLLENTRILSIENNISNFDGVASGQLIIKIKNNNNNVNNTVKIKDFFTKKVQVVKQSDWLNENDEYKFRFNFPNSTKNILEKINKISPKTLRDRYPKKALRTCAMLLNMEDKFVETKINKQRNCKYYKYYQGSKALYDKFCNLFSDKYFYYDKKLQNEINDLLKKDLTKKGIKNKKRIGLGDFLVYDNAKIYIRQSAKEIIASYDGSPSSANNSLYVFSLRNNNKETKDYLKFLCGYLNSEILSFYAQKKEIIRYREGKQPQIKISDLYSIPIPQDIDLQRKISNLVDNIYINDGNKKEFMNQINQIIYDFYGLTKKQIAFVKNSILDFLKS